MMQHNVGLGASPSETIFKIIFIMVHYDGCFNLPQVFPGIQKGNKCITTKVAACKHVEGLAYFGRGGLEK